MEERLLLKTPVLKTVEDVLDLCTARALTPPSSRHPSPPSVSSRFAGLLQEWMTKMQHKIKDGEAIDAKRIFIKLLFCLCVNVLGRDDKLCIVKSPVFQWIKQTVPESSIADAWLKTVPPNPCNERAARAITELVVGGAYRHVIGMIDLLSWICTYEEHQHGICPRINEGMKVAYAVMVFVFRGARVETLTLQHYVWASQWATHIASLPGTALLEDIAERFQRLNPGAQRCQTLHALTSTWELLIGHKRDPAWRFTFMAGLVDAVCHVEFEDPRAICMLAFLPIRDRVKTDSRAHLNEWWTLLFDCLYVGSLCNASSRVKKLLRLCKEAYPDESLISPLFQERFEKKSNRLWKAVTKG